MTDGRNRSPQEVFDDHLELAARGEYEEDIRRNVSEDVVVLSTYGVHRGHEGVTELAELLAEQLPNGTFVYTNRLVEGEVAFLEWTGHSERAQVRDGADSFIIRDGRIVVQTIHYTVEMLD